MNKKVQRHLAKDPIFKPLVDAIQLAPLTTDAAPNLYVALVRSIIFQQLSGKAASSIYQRFLNLFEDQTPNPKQILQLDLETLRGAGLSRQKAGYVQNVAHFFQTHQLEKKDWTKVPDETILTQLTQIKGVGTWTVQMILMFNLQRPDIFPMDDLVVRQSIIQLYGVKETGRALKPRLLEIATAWQPYRSTASRYLWRWKDQF
ncbi:MAG: DNA-3-methyladenine glycosylase [Saprospiraceae bacterium]